MVCVERSTTPHGRHRADDPNPNSRSIPGRKLTPPSRAEKPPRRGDGYPRGNLLRYLLVRRTPETRQPRRRQHVVRFHDGTHRLRVVDVRPRGGRQRQRLLALLVRASRIVTETVLLVSLATNVSVPEAAV